MQKSFLCIGHRGAMGHEPENTLISIRKALLLGAACVEIDVYFVDGNIIVFHDDSLERTTNGTGMLSEKSFEYLRSLDAGKGQLIPTLAEVCEEINFQASVNIELKGPHTAVPVAEYLTDLISKNIGWDKNSFLISSFNKNELLSIRKLYPDFKLGVLTSENINNDFIFAEEIGAYSIHHTLDLVDEQFVNKAQAAGFKVFIYTVNSPEDIHKMYELGVDGVFTNFPERVLQAYPQMKKEIQFN